MDIYILRDGKEIGPFSEDTTQTLLKQGSIAEADYAWHPGLPKWIPLADVLRPAPALETPPPPPPTAALETPLPAPSPAANLPKAGESATEKQKALLAYLGVSFSAEISKDQAALLVNDAMEDAKNGGRLVQWNTDRLKLHPELFAAEIQTKKESRAGEFFEICETEGAEYFTKIAKAHCQVLVGYLDVKFPNWDEDKDAAKKYFFPAVAEKFPQLVAKPWKGKLRYATGSKIAAEMGRERPATGRLRKRGKSSGLPLAAIGRGLVFGVLILAMYFFVQKVFNSGAAKSHAPGDKSAGGQAEIPAPKAVAPLPVAVKPDALPAIEPEKMIADGDPTKPAAVAVLPGDAIMVDPPNPAIAVPADPKMAALPGEPAMIPDPLAPKPAAPPAGFPPDPPMANDPAAPKPSALPGFPPDPPLVNGAAPAAVPDPLAPAPAPAPVPADPAVAAKVNLKLTKQIEVQLAYGKMKLPVGTPVKLVAREGNALRVNYLNTILVVPVTSTDFAEAAPAPVHPAPSPASAPAPAAVPPPSPDL